MNAREEFPLILPLVLNFQIGLIKIISLVCLILVPVLLGPSTGFGNQRIGKGLDRVLCNHGSQNLVSYSKEKYKS